MGDASLYGYEVLRSATAGGPYTQIATVTSTSFNDTAVEEAATYFYVVRRDLLARGLGKVSVPEQVRVDEVMTRQVFSLRPDEPLTHALALMDSGGFRHALVQEGNSLLGAVTASCVVRYLVSLLPEELRVLPTRQSPSDREGA